MKVAVLKLWFAWKMIYRNWHIGFDDDYCPSPIVMLKGRIITTPPRSFPKFDISNIKVEDQANIDNENEMEAKNVEIFIERECEDNQTNMEQTSTPKNTTNGIQKSPTITLTANKPHKRQISDEATLLKLTKQNTKANSGYQKSELIFEQVILKKDPPDSPSDKFHLTSSTPRKWAQRDHEKAHQITRDKWRESFVNPQAYQRKLKWSPDISIADSFDDKIRQDNCQNDHFIESILISNDFDFSKIKSPPKEKEKIVIKKIVYLPPSKKKRKKPLKRKKKN